MSESIDLDKMSFEQLLDRIEEFAQKMENGKLPLEELMRDFEQADAMLKLCRAKLETLEKKIKILESDDGKSGQWRDFNDAPQSRNAPANQTVAAAADGEDDSCDLPF